MLKAPLTLMLGMTIGAVAGPMVSGAIGTAFWSTAADTNDPQRVAARLYRRAQVSLPADAFRFDDRSPCREEFQRFARAKSAHPGAVELAWRLDDARDDIISGKYGDLAVQTLESMPAPILGALDGCVGGSPASAFCLKYIADRAEKAVSISRERQQAWIVMADRQITAPWCAAKSMSIPDIITDPAAS